MEQPHAPSILYPHHHGVPVARVQAPQFIGQDIRPF
jgi:hypothetical protein